MKSFKPLLVIVVIFSFTDSLHGGLYSNNRNSPGVYIQTGLDGPWIPDSDRAAKSLTPESGSYSVRSGRPGTYIRADQHGNLYIDRQEAERPAQAIKSFSAAQDGQVIETETKIRINGNQVLVPVALGYQGNERQALFLLDTGASIVVLHREIAEILRIEKNQSAEFMVPGGRIISTDVAVLNYVGVGPFRKEKLRVAVIDHQGKSIPYQGLLGMNFLRHFYYRIDFKRQVIVWSR